MTDNSSSDEYEPRATGARIHTLKNDPNAVRNVDGSLQQKLTETYAGDRSLYDALGYVNNPRFGHFKARYKRGGTATALVDKPPKDCWGETPTIRDGDHTTGEEERTEFEKEVKRFLEGEHTRTSPIERLQTADEKARLGQYSVILIGFDDEAVGDSSEGLQNPVDENSIESLGDVNYLSVFDESDVPYSGIDWDTNPSSPRFNQPDTYEIDYGHGTYTTHHSRVLHICEGSDIVSDSVLLRSLNRLDDIEKILGGSAEAFWRAAYQGLVIKPPEQLPSGKSASDYGSDLERQIKRYRHNMNREIFSSGEIDTIDTEVASPEDHLNGQYQEIAAGHDIPQSMLRGNETGERATQEDRAMYHEYIARRRRQHAESTLLRALLDLLIDVGALIEPEDKDNDYTIEWPPLSELSEQEEAEVFNERATAWNNITGGMPQEVLSEGEMRKEGGFDPEIGGEIADHEVDGMPDADATDSQEQDDVEQAVTNLRQIRLEDEPADSVPGEYVDVEHLEGEDEVGEEDHTDADVGVEAEAATAGDDA